MRRRMEEDNRLNMAYGRPRRIVHNGTGKPRRNNVVRDTDADSKSRGERPEDVVAVAMCYRTREVGPKDALDPLAGFTLGKLLLRGRVDPSDPGSISQDQYEAGEAWAKLCRLHSQIHGYSLGPKSPSTDMIGQGLSCIKEPDKETIIQIRRKWEDCYNSLMEACRSHGLKVRNITFSVCVENIEIGALGTSDFGLLRIGLNAVGKSLR